MLGRSGVPTPPARSRGAAWRRALLGVVLLAAGCGEPEVVPIARDGASGSAGGGAAGAGADAGAGGDARGPRGRVRTVNGRLVTDRGTPLRGVSIEADLGVAFAVDEEPEAARPAIRRMFDRLALELGLNAFQVYLEGWNVEAGTRAAFADVLVEESGRAGLYLVLGPGVGPRRDGKGGTGWFDPAAVGAFWAFYAPRYAQNEHVLYQLYKVPERTCDAVWQTEALALEREKYLQIRDAAPDTRVLVFSYGEAPTVASLQGNLDAVSSAIDFRNASVGFHAHTDCVSLDEVDDYPVMQAGAELSFLATELPPSDWGNALTAMESRGIGWMHFHWVQQSDDLMAFRFAHESAGISWCPDFGTWPQDAASCATP